MRKHSNLHSLISSNAGARRYYNGLPEHVRDMVGACSDMIGSFGALIDHAETFKDNG